MSEEVVNLNEVTQMYRILGLPPSATKEQVREARNRLLVRFHPDKQQFDPNIDEQAMNDRARFIQAAFLYITHNYRAIQSALDFLPNAMLTNQIPASVRSYWVYSSIERIPSPDQEA
ncbi:MAG: J domain-containing protein [Candidatus Berkiella sp.]